MFSENNIIYRIPNGNLDSFINSDPTLFNTFYPLNVWINVKHKDIDTVLISF